jgi:hypothetical protein
MPIAVLPNERAKRSLCGNGIDQKFNAMAKRAGREAPRGNVAVTVSAGSARLANPRLRGWQIGGKSLRTIGLVRAEVLIGLKDHAQPATAGALLERVSAARFEESARGAERSAGCKRSIERQGCAHRDLEAPASMAPLTSPGSFAIAQPVPLDWGRTAY